MIRPGRFLAYSVLAVILALIVDYTLVRGKVARVASIVTEFGGNCGSLDLWPIGSEYWVTFPRPLTSAELDQLAELNTLRGTVGVMFHCELSDVEMADGAAKLPGCTLYHLLDGEMQRFASVNANANPTE